MIPRMHARRCLLGGVAAVVAGIVSAQAPEPPRALKREHRVESPHGSRSDEYYWLRDDDPKKKRTEVMQHLQAENAYTEATLERLRPARQKLLGEMRARIVADESTAPVYDDGWWHWRQFEPGNEHPKLMRRRGSPERMDPGARAEVLLDLPRLAIAHPYYSLGAVAVSPDGQWVAWTEDTTGRRIHSLFIENLKTRRLLPERIHGVLENIVWAADSRTLFYVKQDPVTLQSGIVHRHRIATDPAGDTVVHDEADKTLFVDVRRSASRRHVLIDISGTDVTELRAVRGDDPEAPARVVLPRRAGVRTQADHLGGRWVLRTNDSAPNFRLVEAPEEAPADREGWRTLVAPRDQASIEGFVLFDRGIVVEERVDAERRVRLLGDDGAMPAAEAVALPADAVPPRLRGIIVGGPPGGPATPRREHRIEAGPAATAALGDNRDPAAAHVQVVLQSLVRPPTTVDVHLSSRREIVRKQERVAGFDPTQYRTERLWARSRDGARIPLTLAWRADRAARNGRAPLLAEAYGAYGESLDPTFAAHRLSLLDRGFVHAIVHVRGGGELGQAWYESGRLTHKQHSFDDFVDATEHLLREGWAAPGKVFAQGSSAGGLLVAAVANQAGHLYRGMALDMPFVDVVTTMLDASIPLTTNEWRQWGDPREKAAYDYLLSYSPYDNIARRDYPAMIVTTALWDPQVQYYEPVKYVARLREARTDRNPLLLHIEMSGGHGPSGRYERLRHWARQYALFLDLAGIEP